MNEDFLQVPSFARLADYCDLWLMSPLHAEMFRHMAKSMKFSAHFEKEPEPLKSVTDKVAATGGKSIAVISLTGLLMKSQSSMGGTSTVQARREIRQAANDPEVVGIILRVDSPGGTSAGTADLADEVKAATKRKPVMAQVEDLAASAAVWAISPAMKIYANHGKALYGSIGTYQVLYDTSAAGEANGEKTILVATGPLKGMGVEGTKITAEQIAHVQGLVNSVQESFDAAVKKGRNLTQTQLTAVKHGGVMTAEAAMEAGLIDGVQSISKTISDLTAMIRGDMRSENHDGAANVGALPMRPLHGLPTLGD